MIDVDILHAKFFRVCVAHLGSSVPCVARSRNDARI